MDRISFLPDDVLLHLLSLLTTKDVLKTSVLSKRWRNLWKLVPKLKYIDCDENADHGRFLLFVDRSLLLNTAPVLQSLHFKFRRQCSDVDIGFWVRIAAERGLRDFYYYHSAFNEPSRLPQRLFTCGTLVVLKLTNVSLADVKFPVSFPILKTLHLSWVIYLDDESPRKLLSSCPILEDLVVNRDRDDNVTTFSIMVPSLQKLTYCGVSGDEADFVLNAPSLKCLKISDLGYECMVEKMPEIVAANVEVIYWNTDNILGSLTSVKRLSLCLPSESPFPTGKMFNQLVDLEFCTCATGWELLLSFLKHSPKLRALKLNERHGCDIGELWDHRDDEPRCVPETLMFGLETLEWRNYRGWNVEKQLATLLLKHSFHLKRAIFSSVDTNLEDENEMLTELALLPRGSTTCQLVFS
ncbi:Leucine-rich repeat 2 [Arabidopsis thaliana x Arabidopsis arenosa]|uniref:Leucine-rich repeat 2 n=1 Tax=Arabidopsis thaliana x Arabidopsis arenosa TaxID=1240361 RepID=A0A8T1XJK2_9BRAS|nr:Leucine-rich repeat 2 [Arabidopsis thaliana x Arabidopsis arenosa]